MEIINSGEISQKLNSQELKKYRISIFIWQLTLTATMFLGIQNFGPFISDLWNTKFAYYLLATMWLSRLFATSVVTKWVNHRLTIEQSLKLSALGYLLFYVFFYASILTHNPLFIWGSVTIASILTDLAGVSRNEAYAYVGYDSNYINLFFYTGLLFGVFVSFMISFPYSIIASMILAIIPLFFRYPSITPHEHIERNGGSKPLYYLLIIVFVSALATYAQKISLIGTKEYTYLIIATLIVFVVQLIIMKWPRMWHLYTIIWIAITAYILITRQPNLIIFYLLDTVTGAIVVHLQSWGKWKGILNAWSVRSLISFLFWLL